MICTETTLPEKALAAYRAETAHMVVAVVQIQGARAQLVVGGLVKLPTSQDIPDGVFLRTCLALCQRGHVERGIHSLRMFVRAWLMGPPLETISSQECQHGQGRCAGGLGD